MNNTLCRTTLFAVLLFLLGQAQSAVVDQENVDGTFLDWYAPLIEPGEAESFAAVQQALQARKLKQARTELGKLMLSHPRHPGVWELKGTLEMMERRLPEARQALEQAAELAPEVASIQSKLAAVLLQLGEVAGAKQALQKSLAADSAAPLTRLLLARIARHEGDMSAAIAHFQVAVKSEPSFGALHAELADLYLLSQQPDAAEALIDSVPHKDNVDIALLRARAALARRAYPQARNLVKKAQKLGADPVTSTLFLSSIERLSGKPAKAEKMMRALVRKNPKRPLLLNELALTLAVQGKTDESLKLIDKASALLPSSHPIRFDLFQLASELGDVGLAMRVLQQEAQSANATKEVLFNYARAALSVGELKAADAATASLLERFDNFSPAYALRAEYVLRRGDVDKALSLQAQATSRFADDPAPWQIRVAMLLRLERYTAARKAVNAGLKRHSKNLTLRFQLANTLQLLGEVSKAETVYRALLNNDNARLISLNNLANMLAEIPARRAEALKYATEALGLAPNSAVTQDTYGWVLHLNGRSTEGLSSIQAALKTAPGDAAVVCHLGLVSAAVDGAARARAQLERCVALDPDSKLGAAASALL